MTTQTKTIEKIRASYTTQKTDSLYQLKQLDKKVKRPVRIFSYVFGSLSSLVLGTGMCFAMKVIGATLPHVMSLGIAIGLVGIFLVSINYPIYKGILNARKKKYSNRIIELSDALLNKNN